jgi:transposase InsO family protein
MPRWRASSTRSKPNSFITGNMQHEQRDIFAYIEGFYNRTRRHSAIGYISPIERELKAA